MAVAFISRAIDDSKLVQSLVAVLHMSGAGELYPTDAEPVSYDTWDAQLLAWTGRCQAVILVVTKSWLASAECYGQFRAAWYMGKRIIPILFLPNRPEEGTAEARRLAELLSETQALDLASSIAPDGALALRPDASLTAQINWILRSAGVLNDVGLDPTVFDVDRSTKPSPFPGLASYGDTDGDAAVFFGRDREIGLVLEELRRMHAEADYRPLVILGASGSGKSSLLKAGVLPRLRRETPAWLAVRAFRPGPNPLFSFAQALSRSLESYQNTTAPSHIYARLSKAWETASQQPREQDESGKRKPLGRVAKATLIDALNNEFFSLRQAAQLPNACILISVDQAEELVRAVDASNAFSELIGICLDQQSLNARLALTIRSDSFPALQADRWFEGLECRAFDLRAMNKHNYHDVIAAPAERYGVRVDPLLIEALINAAPSSDALPLVAFAMQRLWERSSISGVIGISDYEQFDGLLGLLEDAAERALRGINNPDDQLPKTKPPANLTQLATRTFVPALVDINETGQMIKRVAPRGVFDEDQLEFLSRFEHWRLLIAGTDSVGGHTLEVAHEALFREWSRFREWVEPERSNLEVLRQVRSAAQTWVKRGRDHDYLPHRAHERLSRTMSLLANERYRQRLGPDDHAYLEACREAFDRDRRQRRRVRAVLGALGALIALGIVAFLNQQALVREVFWLVAVREYALDLPMEARLKPGDKFYECKSERFCPEMVVIPAGQFVMGQKDGEEDERDQKAVTIARPIAVSRLEITFDQWDTCYQMGGCNLGARIADGGMPRGRYPVVNVSYWHAKAYVKWLGEMTGKSYRLLSEAEWEYAARAGTTTRYSFGDLDEDICAYGNVADLTMRARRPQFPTVNCDDGYYVIAPVGSYKANPFGLQDMHGNVAEWTDDCYEKSYLQSPTDGAPVRTGDCSKRVVRGGGWDSEPGFHRSANRTADPTEYMATSVGIRVGRDLRTGRQ
jgi:formylglycine-generating enzyme required for sulfatase activity